VASTAGSRRNKYTGFVKLADHYGRIIVLFGRSSARRIVP
jgi:hypothetical protein